MEHIPVIVGIGEIIDRPDDPLQSLEPLALMAEALRRASADAGCDLNSLDSIDIVHQVSWRYEKTAQRFSEILGIQPARAVYGVTGGESPVRYLHEAALRVARGESEFAAVVSAEAQYAVNKAKANGLELPWTPIARDVENPFPIEGRLNPQAIAHGAIRPIHVYPFYENASHHSWGQSPREALNESGAMWSRFSRVAAQNPYSWSKRSYEPLEVTTPSNDNRLISYPYTKRMVANPAVNQGAAVIITTLERARALGIDDSHLVFVLGGASGFEPRDYLKRDQYVRSDAQEAVLKATCRVLEANGQTVPALELYSCFPCVPKMTRRVLNLDVDVTPTVTGGLSFFGAPLNGYMTHATCAVVRHLRAGKAESGLLYGQGEFVTKHHALVVARTAPRMDLQKEYSVQPEIDRRREAVPPLLTDYSGKTTIETHTVFFDRHGLPQQGVVIARTPDARLIARVPSNDSATLQTLLDPERSPIALMGNVTKGTDGFLQFEL